MVLPQKLLADSYSYWSTLTTIDQFISLPTDIYKSSSVSFELYNRQYKSHKQPPATVTIDLKLNSCRPKDINVDRH